MCVESPTALVDTLRQAIQQSQSGVNAFGPMYDEDILAAKLRGIVAMLPTARPQEGQAEVTMTMIPAQAEAVCKALDIYSRLCLGQFNIVGEMVSRGDIPMRGNASAEREVASVAQVRRFEETMIAAKEILGYSRNASSGISDAHVSPQARRCYEVQKATQCALANFRNPTPSFSTVDYDGLFIRYTTDPAPKATVAQP